MADPVWMLVMFDLPTNTKSERRQANTYRNLLKDHGFERVQWSVYVKYYLNRTSSEFDVKVLSANIQPGGNVRILQVADSQWANTLYYEGAEKKAPEPVSEQLSLFF